MIITDILTRDRVLANLSASTKPAVIDELAGLLVPTIPAASREQIAAVLRERERLNSTAIGEGVAIPHGRMPHVQTVVAGFARHPAGVDFESVDGKPTRLFFVLVAPDDAAAMHLKALARISRLIKDPEFRERLLSLANADEIFDAIVAEDLRF